MCCVYECIFLFLSSLFKREQNKLAAHIFHRTNDWEKVWIKKKNRTKNERNAIESRRQTSTDKKICRSLEWRDTCRQRSNLARPKATQKREKIEKSTREKAFIMKSKTITFDLFILSENALCTIRALICSAPHSAAVGMGIGSAWWLCIQENIAQKHESLHPSLWLECDMCVASANISNEANNGDQ